MTGSTTLKASVRVNVRQALIQQIARRMDDNHIPQTSKETLSMVVEADAPVQKLLEAVYAQGNVEGMSNRAVGKLIAEVNRTRRQKTERVPVRSH